ncbi:glycosyl hydrolase family 2 [Prevotella sp. E15-22]|uniref:glycosyl hydrolase n=1 Tax=Prevotella sp. E15-22 TaxID=2937774 RepID=UPI00205FADE1|nr:glycosyl hydrolase [Prevotella sp. E15-22]UPS43341.1 glycosyl hydrolase family 2 [Prevotella sp. E15-22]
MKKLLFIFTLASLTTIASAQSWPTPTTEAKPGTRWWWLGSAVDKENLKWNLSEYAKHGIGAVEITPIYGVQGNDKNNIPYLSDQWLDMLRYTQQQVEHNGIELDMSTGTGWPFGGPWVPLKESACKAVFVSKSLTNSKQAVCDINPAGSDAKNAFLEKVMLYGDGQALDVTSQVSNNQLTLPGSIPFKPKSIVALYIKYGVMKVKRAAPGGEGLVIDHFDRNAVAHYLQHIEQAFERTKTPYPHTFFNDSYEVEAGTWTPTLLDEFEKRRGYKLENHFPELLAYEPQVLSDYRETLGDLLLENFTRQWTAWAHKHGAITRNQAHGSPANLIDCYAAVDIPEIEGFGLSDFGIKGLRQDPGKTRKNDSDFSMLKYAPSAAHICGKTYTSSETFTWLTEHFRTSLSQLKPDIDLMFCAGVNHMFFHGTCYSPKDDEWPGWKFYASIDMSPTNSIWRDAPFFMDYVTRCQSFLQMGQPDNDFLVYLPVRDMWKKNTGKLLMQFSIHAMGQLAPEFIKSILAIEKAGYDCDYISDQLLEKVRRDGNRLVTEAGTSYKAIVIPTGTTITPQLKRTLERLSPMVIYGENDADMARFAQPELMKSKLGLKAIRRKNDNGYHYFIANLTPNDVDEDVTIAVPFKDALWFNPLNGDIARCECSNGNKVSIHLKSGESMILQLFNEEITANISPLNAGKDSREIAINGPWNLSFIDSSIDTNKSYKIDTLKTWENLNDETSALMGTGVYTTTLKLSKKALGDGQWLIDLGDVRESARVYINGQFVGCAWSVPFILDTKGTLKAGSNELRIEVTNLPANRIASLDRQGVKWRKMEEINVVDINYKKTTYDQWEPMPSGLNSPIRLIKN